MPFSFVPLKSVFTEHNCKFRRIFGSFDNRFESARGIRIVWFIIHHTRLNVVLSALDIDEIVSGGAVIFYQSKFRFLPVVSVRAFCETHPLVPTIVVPVSEIPHPEFVADAVDRPVVNDAGTVWRAGRTGRHHNSGPIDPSSIRHKL